MVRCLGEANLELPNLRHQHMEDILNPMPHSRLRTESPPSSPSMACPSRPLLVLEATRPRRLGVTKLPSRIILVLQALPPLEEFQVSPLDSPTCSWVLVDLDSRNRSNYHLNPELAL